MHSRHLSLALRCPADEPVIEIRACTDADEESLLAALSARAPACRPERGAPTAAELAWLRRAPQGARTYLAVDGRRLLAHVSAVSHLVWMNAAEHRFAELLGVFVAPEQRRGLHKRGLFVRLAKELIRRHQGVDGDFVYYGWPTREEWRIGKRLLGYEAVRTLVVLARPVESGASRLPVGVERLERFDHQARWLWDRCVGDFGASTIRDDTFLNHRFVGRPEHAYEAYGVRDGEGVLRGYAVFRLGPWIAPNTGLVCDWLVPPGEPEVGDLLLEACVARARAERASEVVCVLPEWSFWFDRLQRQGFFAVDGRRLLAARPGARRFDATWLRAQWWFTLADTLVV